MYTFSDKFARFHLSEDLETLIFCNDTCSFTATSPFRFRYYDREIDLARLADERNVTEIENGLSFSFCAFTYEARFPGNTYFRPERRHAPDFKVSFSVQLINGELVFKTAPIENLGNGPARLILAQEFFHLDSRKPANLVLPWNFGMNFTFPREDYLKTSFEPCPQIALPMHAVFTPQGGIGMWCDDPDRELFLEINASTRTDSIARMELRYDELANDGRMFKFVLFPASADVRDLGAYIRQELKNQGHLKTLKEKAAEDPEVEWLAGAVFWKHNTFYKKRPEGIEKTWSLYTMKPHWNTSEGKPGNWTCEEIFTTAKERGFDRVFVYNTGWNYGGYDCQLPKRLPPNPKRGTADDFRNAAKDARKLSPTYVLSCHDNYIDAYEDGPEYHPEEMYQRIAGVPLEGFVWRGGMAHSISSEYAIKYAERDMPKIADITGRGGIYLDVTAAMPPQQSRCPGHTLTRKQDIENRRTVFKTARKYFGTVSSEGCGTSMFADILAAGCYGALHYIGVLPQTTPYPIPVPLWQLVYHDCIYNYFGEGYALTHGDEFRLWQALFCLLPASLDNHAYRLSHELRTAYSSPMTDYEVLVPMTVTRDQEGAFHTTGVAQSTFGDGTKVIVNFMDESFALQDGTELAPRSWITKK